MSFIARLALSCLSKEWGRLCLSNVSDAADVNGSTVTKRNLPIFVSSEGLILLGYKGGIKCFCSRTKECFLHCLNKHL